MNKQIKFIYEYFYQHYKMSCQSTPKKIPKRGRKGRKGPDGPRGDRGDKGDTGQTGDKGATGCEGCQGPRGLKGPTGLTGEAGCPGSTGHKGIKGPKGPTGAKGPSGATGPSGYTGPTGIVGPTGPVGPLGHRGPDGPNGKGVYTAYFVHVEGQTVSADSKNINRGNFLFAPAIVNDIASGVTYDSSLTEGTLFTLQEGVYAVDFVVECEPATNGYCVVALFNYDTREIFNGSAFEGTDSVNSQIVTGSCIIEIATQTNITLRNKSVVTVSSNNTLSDPNEVLIPDTTIRFCKIS